METITYTQDGTTYELPTELVRLIRQDHRHRGTGSKAHGGGVSSPYRHLAAAGQRAAHLGISARRADRMGGPITDRPASM